MTTSTATSAPIRTAVRTAGYRAKANAAVHVTVHTPGTEPLDRPTACGQKPWQWDGATTTDAEVTCKRCLSTLHAYDRAETDAPARRAAAAAGTEDTPEQGAPSPLMRVHNGGMTTTSTTYARGTKTTRMTTAKIAAAPGTWVLTVDATDEHKARLAAKDYASEAAVTNTDTKTGTTLRQVESAEAVMHAASGYYRRASRTYTLRFTDGSYSYGNAPANTWMTVEAPAEVAPVAEPVAEVAPVAEVVTEAPAATGEQVLGRKLAAGHRIKIKGAGVVLVSAATVAGRKVTVAWIANGVTGTTEVWASSRFRLAA